MTFFANFSRRALSTSSKLKKSHVQELRHLIELQFPRLKEANPSPLRTNEWSLQKAGGPIFFLLDGKPTFWKRREVDAIFIPTLRFALRFPFFVPVFQCDGGAIRHLIGGASCMCQGLTSPGGMMEEVPESAVVLIQGEGKSMPFAVGITTMSTADIREKNQGPAVDVLTMIHDPLWRLKDFEF